MNITNIDKGYNKFSFVLTERLTTARDTYDIMLKLNTEQETGGEFDILLDNLKDISKDKDFEIYVHPDIFTGREDVILELLVTISLGKTIDVKDIDNELVLGSILKEIKEHFNVYYNNRPDYVQSDVIKSYFKNY
jgi:hypothetical protein